MQDETPTWAADLRPLSHEQASEALGVCPKTLYRTVAVHPNCCEWRGSKRVFYPEHIKSLRKFMDRVSRATGTVAATPDIVARSVRSTLRVEPYDLGHKITGRLNGRDVRVRYQGASHREVAAIIEKMEQAEARS